MLGYPVDDLTGGIHDFLSSIEESLAYPHQTPIRCDQCAEVIHPNNPCGLLITDRFVGEDESVTEFRLARIECQDCRPPSMMYSVPGYTELLLTGRFDAEYTLRDVHLVTLSGRGSGLEWDPVAVQDLFDPSGEAWLDSSPFDMIRSISAFIDPREVIDPETGALLISEDDREGFQLLFAYVVASRERTDDELKALKQTVHEELSTEEIRQHCEYLDSNLQEMVEEKLLL